MKDMAVVRPVSLRRIHQRKTQNMRFVAIDFETANSDRSSACAIGMVIVEDGQILDKRYHLIKPSDPYFDPFNISIHGITEEDVENEPEFDELWPSIKDYFGNRMVIAHNASFDMSVLRHVLDEYGIPYPDLPYSCTYVISKKMWSALSRHSLDVVADHLSIEFAHHDAAEDASACARIATHACELTGVDSLDELASHLEFTNGCLFPGGYKPARLSLPKSYNIRPKEIATSVDGQDPTHTFSGKAFVFTGALQSMSRKQAMQKAVDVGGICTTTVSRVTNFVVLGQQDYRNLRDGKRSNKMKKAEELIDCGSKIEFISEKDFLEML